MLQASPKKKGWQNGDGNKASAPGLLDKPTYGPNKYYIIETVLLDWPNSKNATYNCGKTTMGYGLSRTHDTSESSITCGTYPKV